MKTKIVLGLALALASPALAQTLSQDPGAMKCADYVKNAKSSATGLGSTKTGDAEADAMIAETGRKTLKVCTASPTITVREALIKAMAEED